MYEATDSKISSAHLTPPTFDASSVESSVQQRRAITVFGTTSTPSRLSTAWVSLLIEKRAGDSLMTCFIAANSWCCTTSASNGTNMSRSSPVSIISLDSASAICIRTCVPARCCKLYQYIDNHKASRAILWFSDFAVITHWMFAWSVHHVNTTFASIELHLIIQ